MSFLISVDVSGNPTTNMPKENEAIVTVQISDDELTTTVADELVTAKSAQENNITTLETLYYIF